ncbi:MAG: DEAD/DEAH box helicase [Candidatus Thermoplasmatota archaeon]|nr:DEAD/DEAH box helicase [Candidatus Thermoplasmatota archaeon]
MYINEEYIKFNTIEHREYQLNIANSASKKNTLVVLPTGLGKTVIALILIARQLKKDYNKILFLAPTKPLVIQHAQFIKQFITIDEELIAAFTGELPPEKRCKMWEKSRIIVSTPQVIENDILSKRINLNDVSFIIFDECHHAVGDYSYVFISEMFQKQRKDRLVLGMTASPGNDVKKILEICKNLDINNIEIRTKFDPDVKPYVHYLEIIWKEIDLPRDFSYTIQLLRKALTKRLEVLKNLGFIDSSSVNSITRKQLLDAQKKIQEEIRNNIKPSKILFKAASIQSEAIKIHYALELLQTQGVNAFKNYFQRIGHEAVSKGASKSSKAIISDKDIIEAITYIKSLNIEHPKIQEIAKIIEQQLNLKPDSKIIVFTHYRDTSSYILQILQNVKNAKPVRFIGQAVKDKDKGLTQKEQAKIIQNFKDGEYNILVATSVAEEGLDIPSTDLVVFYEPIPSEIRAIQRRGRTGRKTAGKVIILITKGTPDEAYYWTSKRKEKQMRYELELIRSKLCKKIEDAQTLYEKIAKKPDLNQMSLKDYDNNKNEKKIKIIVDHREYRSSVVKNLSLKNINIESQQLDIGDYVLSSRIGVERKDVDDFLESLIDGKLFKQIAHLRDTYSRPLFILEGENLLTKRNINHNAIFGSLASITVDYGIPILTTKNSLETADLLSIIAKREQMNGKKDIVMRGEKPQMSLKQRQQFIVEGLPNVSAVLAKRLLHHFGSIKDIVNASEEELMEIRGIGKNIASDIIKLINSNYLED